MQMDLYVSVNVVIRSTSDNCKRVCVRAPEARGRHKRQGRARAVERVSDRGETSMCAEECVARSAGEGGERMERVEGERLGRRWRTTRWTALYFRLPGALPPRTSAATSCGFGSPNRRHRSSYFVFRSSRSFSMRPRKTLNE